MVETGGGEEGSVVVRARVWGLVESWRVYRGDGKVYKG